MSLKCMIDKWLHKGQISQEEYDAVIKKLEGHDKQVRAEILKEIDEYKVLTNSENVWLVSKEWMETIKEQIRAKTIDELTNNLANDTWLEEHDKQVRADAIDECIKLLVMIMPSEPFLKKIKHYENWKMKTMELRMLRDMLEQLKEQKK